MMDLAELVGTSLLVLLEDGAIIVGILEAGHIGNFLDLHLRVLQQELLAFLDPNGMNILEHSQVGCLLE